MADDASPSRSRDISPSKDKIPGCSRGCLLSGLAAFAFIFVFGMGLGFPNTYWHHLSDIQAFEGPDRVVLFVEIERAMKWPGLIGRAPHNLAAGFLRIDIFPDGCTERTHLQSDLKGHITLNANLYAVAHLADGFYLIVDPTFAPKPAYRFGPDRVDPLSSEEAIRAKGEDILPRSDRFLDFSELDTVSAKHGWQRLHREDDWRYPSPLGLIKSTRHGLKLWQAGKSRNHGTPQSITAESLSPDNRWTRTLLEMKRQPWKSYKGPGDRDYLREQYAANPAR